MPSLTMLITLPKANPNIKIMLLINADFSLKAVIIENGWLELDSINDYEIYQKMYNNNSLKELIVLGD